MESIACISGLEKAFESIWDIFLKSWKKGLFFI